MIVNQLIVFPGVFQLVYTDQFYLHHDGLTSCHHTSRTSSIYFHLPQGKNLLASLLPKEQTQPLLFTSQPTAHARMQRIDTPFLFDSLHPSENIASSPFLSSRPSHIHQGFSSLPLLQIPKQLSHGLQRVHALDLMLPFLPSLQIEGAPATILRAELFRRTSNLLALPSNLLPSHKLW